MSGVEARHKIDGLAEAVDVGSLPELAGTVMQVLRARPVRLVWSGGRDLIPITANRIQDWIEQAQPRLPGFGMIRHGEEVAPERISRTAVIRGRPVAGLPDAAAIALRLSSGHTLVLSAPDAWSPEVDEFADQLRRAFGAEPLITCVASPPNEWAFRRHEDPEDVLIFRLAGTKRWSIGGEDETATDVVMHPGDVLYLPPNVPHQVFGTDLGSIAMTVGLAFEALPVRAARIVAAMLEDVPKTDRWTDEDLAGAINRLGSVAARWVPDDYSGEPIRPPRRFPAGLGSLIYVELPSGFSQPRNLAKSHSDRRLQKQSPHVGDGDRSSTAHDST
jgi:mannose-6-phosphate isomerase-like protein (cupin superfamily)